MTVNKMLDLYVTYGLEEETWNMMRSMVYHGLLKKETWDAFWDKARGLQYGGKYNELVIDTARNDKVVFKMDDQGYYRKV